MIRTATEREKSLTILTPSGEEREYTFRLDADDRQAPAEWWRAPLVAQLRREFGLGTLRPLARPDHYQWG